MATPTPAPTDQPLTASQLGAAMQSIVSGLSGGTGVAGKFTWTPPRSATPAAPTTGIERRLISGGLTTLGATYPESLDATAFGQRLSTLDESQIKSLQEKLYTSGAYPASYYGKNAKQIPWGQRDPDTMQLLQSMASLATFTGNLDQILSSKADLASLTASRRVPNVVELPNPDDMKVVLRKAAYDDLGRDPTPAELDRFSSVFTKAVRTYQEQQYAAGEAGGTVTQAPSGTAAAESFVQQASPVEYGAQRMEDGLGVLLKLFTGGGGGG